MMRATEIENELARRRLIAAARWSHKNEGTAETHDHASRTHQGALARLHLAGQISIDELAWAVEIAMVAESIERDVAVRVISYEPRIDCSASAKNSMVEGIARVRREVAYTYWRERIPQPKRAILDMIVGEPKAFSAVAREYRMGKGRARQLLIDAINLWPGAMDRAEKDVDDATLAAAYAGLI